MADIIQVVSVVIAIVSAVVSIVFAMRARRDTRIQQQMQLLSLNQQYYSELQQWADKVVEAITEAIFLYPGSPTSTEKEDLAFNRSPILGKLSALIDQGRFFLPNEGVRIDNEQYKPSAYRGYRPPALSRIVRVYRLLERSEVSNNQLCDELWKERKEFVSELQDILNPRERENQLKQLRHDSVWP